MREQKISPSPHPPIPPSPHPILLPLALSLLLGLVGCAPTPKPVVSTPETPQPQQDEDIQLSFSSATLQQFNEKGQPVWLVKVKQAKYTKDKQIGEAENPDGELYQDGKVVYKVKAEKADIVQDGKQLFLKGNIVATDPENGVVLRGNELEWRPQEDLLIVRDRVNGTHQNLQAVAQEAKVKTRQQRVEFSGGVVAKSTEPSLQMRTEHLIWLPKQDKLIGDRPILIDRYKNNQITDRGKGDSAEVNLKTKVATVTKNAQIDLLDPAVQIASNSMDWNFGTEIVTTNAPVRVFHRTENVRVNANKGKLNIPQKTVYLSGKVNSLGQRGQSLQSNQLTWYLDKKLVEAAGDVVYQQSEPRLAFRGQQANGNLDAETIVVKGGNANSGKVVTEIIPQAINR